MNKNFSIEHSLSEEELKVYNVIVSKLDFIGYNIISIEELETDLTELTKNQIICLINQLRERVIIIKYSQKNIEISTTLFKADFIFVNQDEFYINFENVEIFDVEFKQYMGKYITNQIFRSYDDLNRCFLSIEQKLIKKSSKIVVDDFATDILKNIEVKAKCGNYYEKNKDRIKAYNKEYQKKYREKKKVEKLNREVSGEQRGSNG